MPAARLPRWVNRHLPRGSAPRIARRYAEPRGALLLTTGTTSTGVNLRRRSGVNFERRLTHIVLEGKGRPDERSEHKGWWTDNWWVPCADAAGAGLKQAWTRREIGSATQVEAAVADAIAELERR